MKILLIGHDFNFSAGDGISRYSYELYNGLLKHADVRTISTGTLPRPMRALFHINVHDADIVHLMYPDAARVNKGNAKMVVTWHDLRPFTKYLDEAQYRSKPKLIERFNIANSIITRWTLENYENTDAVICNSSQTMKELKNYFSVHDRSDLDKYYHVTPLGVDSDFLNTKLWKGKRSDFAYMGSIHQRHKNLSGMLRIFDKIAESTNANLHIFTFSPNASALLKRELSRYRNISHKNVFLHIGASDKEVARYMPKLAACLQPTKHEGLGMSILAALAMGTNVLVLKDSVMPAETRKYAMSLSEEQFVKKAVELSKRPRPASPKAIAYARSFTWDQTVQETIRAYRKALAK